MTQTPLTIEYSIKPEVAARVKEETLHYLKGWRRPKFAFILWEKTEYHVKERRWGTGLFQMPVESRPDIGSKIQQYKRKGYKIIDYGNFPKLNDADPQRAAHARHHSGADGRNPWDILERDVLRELQDTSQKDILEANNRTLEAKISELQKALNAKKLEESQDVRKNKN